MRQQSVLKDYDVMGPVMELTGVRAICAHE